MPVIPRFLKTMKFDPLNLFVLVFATAFVAANRLLARIGREYYLQNFNLDYGLMVFRIPIITVGILFVLICIANLFRLW